MGSPVSLESQLRAVSVFRSGAVVTRVAQLSPTGSSWPEELAITGLPLSIDDGSVRVRVELASGAPTARGAPHLPEVSDVRVEWVIPTLGQPVEPPSSLELQASLARIRRVEQCLSSQAERADNLSRLSFRLPRRLKGEAPKALRVEVMRGIADWVGRSRRSMVDELSKLRLELQQAREEHARLERRVAEAKAERGIDEERICKRVVARLRPGSSAASTAAPPPPILLVCEYQVQGACWRPTYVVRMSRDGQRAEIGVRALIAQQSGEPWCGVRVRLSTADLRRRVELPVLSSLRIGRQQPPSIPRAWRDPPEGAERLFEGFDAALDAHRRTALTTHTTAKMAAYDARSARALKGSVLSHKKMKDSRSPEAEELAAEREKSMEPRPVAAACAAPPAPPARSRLAKERRSMDMAEEAPPDRVMMDEAVAEVSFEAQEMLSEESLEPAPRAVAEVELEYFRMKLVAWSSPAGERGTLSSVDARRSQLEELSETHFQRAQRLLQMARAKAHQVAPFPVTTTAVEASAGSFDYAFEGSAPVDVPNDGRPHEVALFSREVAVETTLIAVPKLSDQAVRVASFPNPLEAPILAGPADIYMENEFLATSQLSTQPAGAMVQVGLGVEQALKIARNTRFREATEGLLSSALVVRHEVVIEVASRFTAPVRVEVRERVPMYRRQGEDKEIVVEVGAVQPAWEPFNQASPHELKGGKRWRFELPPGQSQKLVYDYSIRIDSKNELVGGNRRD